jgi:hypothetical protein
MEFLISVTVCKSFRIVAFWGKLFFNFSTDSNSATNFALYETHETHIEYLASIYINTFF